MSLINENCLAMCVRFGTTAEYPASIVPDSTCAHVFKERDMCRNKLTQVAGYSAVTPAQFNGLKR